MANKVRIGILGAGRMGRVHARNLAFQIPNAEVAAIADINETVAGECAAECRIPEVYQDPRKVIEDRHIDAVVICSTNDQHAIQIIQAAQEGKHIFCEKPVAQDLEGIDRALAAVEKVGVKFQVGFQRRFDPGFRSAQRLIRKGKIGVPHMVRITSRDPGLAPMEYVKASGGIFVDMTIHDFDMARWIIGSEVKELYTMGNVLIEPALRELGDADTVVISLRYENGALGSIDNSRRSVYGYDQRLEVFGSEGSVVVGNPTGTTTVVSHTKGVSSDKPLYFFTERYAQAYLDEMKDFVDCLVKDRPPTVTGIDGRIPVVMGMAARQSWQENRPVLIESIAAVAKAPAPPPPEPPQELEQPEPLGLDSEPPAIEESDTDITRDADVVSTMKKDAKES